VAAFVHEEGEARIRGLASGREATASGLEPRREHRERARRPLRFRVVLGPSSSFTVDVSAGGFCTEPVRALRRGEEVDGFVLVNGAGVAFSGRVVWVKRNGRDALAPARMGVRFTRVPWDLQKIFAAPSDSPPR